MQDLALMLKGIIKKRRTTDPEDFNGKEVSKQIVTDILEAAHWAPNHGQTEPWHFLVYEKNDIKNFGELHANLYKENTPPEQFLQKKYDKLLHRGDKAAWLIVVVMKRGNKSNIPKLEEIEATACAVQNMLIMATAFGIHSYWGTGGMCYHPSLHQKLELAPEDKILGFVYLGRTDAVDVIGKRNAAFTDKITWM